MSLDKTYWKLELISEEDGDKVFSQKNMFGRTMGYQLTIPLAWIQFISANPDSKYFKFQSLGGVIFVENKNEILEFILNPDD